VDKELQGKVALVTGSARGLGKAIAIELATKGAALLSHHIAPSWLPVSGCLLAATWLPLGLPLGWLPPGCLLTTTSRPPGCLLADMLYRGPAANGMSV